jgi:hypothetical protein
MTDHESTGTIEFESPDRRSLIVTLCRELNAVLTTEQPWEQGCVLHHWEASVPSFEALPKNVIDVALDAWESAGSRLDEIECSGYLETDDGARAWGFVAVRPNEAPVQRSPDVSSVELSQADRGYRLRVQITRLPHNSSDSP